MPSAQRRGALWRPVWPRLLGSGPFVIQIGSFCYQINFHYLPAFYHNVEGLLLSKSGPFVISAFSFLANILPCKAVKMHKNHDIAFLHFARILNNLIQYVCIALQMAITRMHFVLHFL